MIDGNVVNNKANYGIIVALFGNAQAEVNITDNLVSRNGDGIVAESNASTQSVTSQTTNSSSVQLL